MKFLSEITALRKLSELREEFRSQILESYEHKASPCSGCPTLGACCTDAHFVNVRISRLEAVAIKRSLDELSPVHRQTVSQRIGDTVLRYKLESSADAAYSCPLFEPGVGCLVHTTAKPLPCIHHACYENKEDLPPDDILENAERSVERLNRRAYGLHLPLMPLPVAVRNALG